MFLHCITLFYSSQAVAIANFCEKRNKSSQRSNKKRNISSKEILRRFFNFMGFFSLGIRFLLLHDTGLIFRNKSADFFAKRCGNPQSILIYKLRRQIAIALKL